jgi:hypothetical protein
MAGMGPKKNALSDAHKAALAKGREEGRAVRKYLEALDANRPTRGRKRTPDSIRARLERIEAEIDQADPVKRVQLIQERLDLADELRAAESTVDLSELEAGFIASAKGYSDRKGITYAAWREVGVSADTLRKAGIGRGRS